MAETTVHLCSLAINLALQGEAWLAKYVQVCLLHLRNPTSLQLLIIKHYLILILNLELL